MGRRALSRDACTMDTARPQTKDKTQQETAPHVEAAPGLVVACALAPDLPVTDAEIDAILRLLGEDISQILR
jgi:hypothetical protein